MKYQEKKNAAKYGFVYIWRDRKHKRYYIGCHWGTEDDGYICSSPWMKQAYKRRPNDFKRRILTRYIEKSRLYTEEYKWLSQTKTEELKNRYYNLHNHHFSHWSASDNVDQIKKKIIESKKGKSSNSPTKIKQGERRSPSTEFQPGQTPHNIGISMDDRYGDKKSAKIKDKMSKAKKGKTSNSLTKFIPGQKAWNAGLTGGYFITDGISTKRIYDRLSVLPDGWRKGRTFNKER